LMLLNTVVDVGKGSSSSQYWRTMASGGRWPTWPSSLSRWFCSTLAWSGY
jgi:hypothetical protein